MPIQPEDFSASGVTTPAAFAVDITPNDSADLDALTRALYVGVSGDIKLTTAGGDIITLIGVLGGSILPLRCKRVFATGTTATSIVGLS